MAERLPPRLHKALQEIANWNAPYWFKQASMRALAEIGYVQVNPGWSDYKKPPHVITDAGRAYLAAHKGEG